MGPSTRPAATLLAWAAALAACGQPAAPVRSAAPPGGLAGFDALAEAPARAAPVADDAAVGLLVRGDRTLHLEPRLGVPAFAWSRGAPPARLAGLQSLPLAEAARAHLADHAALWGLSPEAVAAAELASLHDLGAGGAVARFRQRVQGVPVFRDELTVLLDRDRQVVAFAGWLSPEAGQAALPAFPLDEADALDRALQDLRGVRLDRGALGPARQAPGGWRELPLVGPAAPGLLLVRPPRVRRVLFHLPGRLEPATHLEVAVGSADSTDAALHAYVFSAADGRLLLRHDLTVRDAFGYRVWADGAPGFLPWDGPQGTAPSPAPSGVPDRYAPPFLAPPLITLAALPPAAFSRSATDPWLAPGATETRGNNADAYADLVAPDGFGAGDLRATVTAPGLFDRAYDVAQPPDASPVQQMASVTQLFYTVNFLHDWFYDSGFDETAGNAQRDNYGRGGAGGDPILAEAQDYSGTDNANMSTPADGGSPRMQMYRFVMSTDVAAAITAPSARTLSQVGPAQFGSQNFDVTGPLALVSDGTAAPSEGCNALVNGAAVAGKIALVDRGTCSFVTKVLNAQAAGAVAVVVANNQPGTLIMAGVDATITIPSLIVVQADGADLKTQLGMGPVAMHLTGTRLVDRDGSVDATIVSHEWTHYLSNRLIGDSVGLVNTMGQGMGEGWSDFGALLLVVRPEDATAPGGAGFAGAYAIGAYASRAITPDSFYYGVRRVPYSTDLGKDPLTFRHVQTGVALPAGVPILFGADGADNAEVHNAGEVWATMLWECYAALLRDTLGGTPRLSFAEAQARMKGYLVTSLKLTPAAPTLLEARDALLAAAWARDPADHALFLQAFARRGAGTRATGPDRYSTDLVGVVESTTGAAGENDLRVLSATLDDSLAPLCGADGTLQAGETGRLTVTVQNVGAGTISAASATVASTTPGVSFPSGSLLSFPATAPLGTARATLPVALDAGATTTPTVVLSLSLDGTGLAAPLPFQVARRANALAVAGQSATDDAEAGTTAWTLGGGASEPGGEWRRVERGPTDHRWLAPDLAIGSDRTLVSPPLEVAATGTFGFTFRHRFNLSTLLAAGVTEFVDGGVVEVSSDGVSWLDAGTKAISNGYNATLTNFGGPLGSRRAFAGQNAAWPGTEVVGVDLGSDYAGKTVWIRFRAVTLGLEGWGWEVDDVAFRNLVNRPFAALVAAGPSCPVAPVARAGAAQSVAGGATVLLDGSASTDPGNLPLTWQWTQASGPAVALGDPAAVRPSFAAPSLPGGATLVFSLAVSNGRLWSAPSASSLATVTVAAVSPPPGSGSSSKKGCGCGGGEASASALLPLLLLGLRRRRPA